MNSQNFDLKKNLSLAFEKLQNNNISEASDIYKKILEFHPDNFESNFYLGTIFAQNNNLKEASVLLEKAIIANPRIPDVHNNLGLIYMRLKENEKAIKSLETSIKLNPKYSAAFCNLGLVHNQLEETEKAKNNFLKAIETNPKNILAYYNLGNLFKKTNEIEDSERYYIKAINLAPNFLDAYTNLMDLFERANLNLKLDEIIKKAEENIKENPTIKLFKGKLLFKSKKYSEVVKILNSIKFKPNEMIKEGSRTVTLAKSYDHLDNFDKAFEYFKITNEINSNLNKDSINKLKFVNTIKKRINFFEKKEIMLWPSSKLNNKTKNPTFLIGFPRSGTTLLDTILRSHSSIDVIEEKPIINEFIDALENKINSNFNNLKNIDENLLDEMRNVYFNSQSKYIKPNDDKIYIDKMPLNIIYVGEIVRIFPNAKFILAIRHPCDCVLSCFMQNFELNDAMANFLNLEDTAKLYNLTMTLWEKYLSALSINFHTIKYEDIVLNFDISVKKILNFLELPWTENVKTFYKKADDRGVINTPSYNQVNQPIYSKSMGRWKNYEKEVSKILPLLDPWIKKYGY